jgi:hypothetical protein
MVQTTGDWSDSARDEASRKKTNIPEASEVCLDRHIETVCWR